MRIAIQTKSGNRIDLGKLSKKGDADSLVSYLMDCEDVMAVMFLRDFEEEEDDERW